MFADMKSMVMKAWHEHYALLAINCMNLESAHAAIRVAEKNRAPIILNLYQGHLAHFPAPVAAAVVKTLAESASVPVTLALDHGKNPDCIRQAFRAGFSGLMIDASAFPLEENVRQTRAVVELAASTALPLAHLMWRITVSFAQSWMKQKRQILRRLLPSIPANMILWAMPFSLTFAKLPSVVRSRLYCTSIMVPL